MRLTTVTIAFFFFGTVFAMPIFSLPGNLVELSKRMDPEGSTSDAASTAPNRGRGSTPGRGRSGRKGKVANLQAEEGVASAGSRSRSSSSKRKDSGDEGSRSTSRKRAKCEPDLVTKEEFLDALKHIDQSKPAGRGSQGLAVYHVDLLVKGCRAVVKIIDRDRLDTDAVKKITGEVAGLRQVKQLFAWGRRTKPKLDYILMKNMGVPLSQTKLDPTKDAEFITNKKTKALELFQKEFKLKHGDPTGNDNYLWYINDEEDPDMDARYDVNVIDWADAEKIGPDTNDFAQAPKPYPVPDEKDIFGPTESPESSKKGSSSPPSNSDDEKKKAGVNIYSGATGTRTSGRIAKLALHQKGGQGTEGEK